MNKFLFLIICIYILGCSQFTKKIDSLSEENKISDSPLKKGRINFCLNNEHQLLIENSEAELFYKTLINKDYFKNKAFIEKMNILILNEAIRRPDVVSPNSRLQILLQINGTTQYYDFSSNDFSQVNQFPLIYGIDYLSSKFKSKSLSQLISEINLNTVSSVPVDSKLETFIKQNQKSISKNQILSERYLKIDEPLTHFETFEKLNLKELEKIYLKNKTNNLYQVEANLDSLKFNLKNKDGTNVLCNFNIESELDSSKIIENENIHYIGLKNNSNSFLAILSSKKILPIIPIENTAFIKAENNLLPIPICKFMKEKNELFFASVLGRSKNQHLKHLNEYEIYTSNSIKNIYDILNFPRHIFLSNPDRIIYESKKGRKDQLNFFLTMNFPIYHIENLGDIIGFVSLKSINSNSLIYDQRSNAELICPE
jgi:hypothetical protein